MGSSGATDGTKYPKLSKITSLFRRGPILIKKLFFFTIFVSIQSFWSYYKCRRLGNTFSLLQSILEKHLERENILRKNDIRKTKETYKS